MYPDSTTKRCSKCGEIKPLDQFKPRKESPDGRRAECRTCRNAVERIRCAHRRKNDPAYLEKARAASRENARRYYADPERYQRAVAYRKDRYYTHQEYRQSVLKRALQSCHARRARTMHNGGSFTEEEWNALCAHYDYRCLCCGGLKPLTRDHVIPISKGGDNSINNIQPLCETCNKSKGNKTIDYRTSHNQHPD